MTCQFCNGPVENIGALGSVSWGRCRNCGALQKYETDELDETWEPDREYQLGYAHACGYRD